MDINYFSEILYNPLTTLNRFMCTEVFYDKATNILRFIQPNKIVEIPELREELFLNKDFHGILTPDGYVLLMDTFLYLTNNTDTTRRIQFDEKEFKFNIYRYAKELNSLILEKELKLCSFKGKFLTKLFLYLQRTWN